MKSLGTTVRSRFQIVALLSHSRCSAPAISTGWTSDLKTLAKVPLTRPSRRCSNFFRTPMGHLLLHLLAGLAGPAGPGRRLFPLLLLLPLLLRELVLLQPVVPQPVPRQPVLPQLLHL